ncbi:hypothetical protein [Kribbella sp. NPDC004536]|uniref:hypothetical protein n=1 Tax=Kribbella sp. NPDC004536 TaxID=3364106 RepID=UPI0036CAD5C2
MDFGHFLRLGKCRRELRTEQDRLRDSGEAELAEGLRPALDAALQTLRRLHDDDEAWDAAENAVAALAGADVAQVRENCVRSLPPLLILFGYTVPPPPPAQQLVDETVSMLKDIGDGDTMAEVRQARRQLGELLARAENLPLLPAWRVPHTATEVNSFIELGLQVAVGSGLGALAGAFVGVAAGAVTGGIAPVAGGVVLGGVRRFRQLHAFEREADEFLQTYERLNAGVFPATALAAEIYLNQVLALSTEHGTDDPYASILVSGNLDALIDISRRLIRDRGRFTVVNQASFLQHNELPHELLPVLSRVYDAADKARSERALYGAISRPALDELARLRDDLVSLLERDRH